MMTISLTKVSVKALRSVILLWFRNSLMSWA